MRYPCGESPERSTAQEELRDTFSGGIITITGGTGSFGNALVRRALASELREIRIFSRDEKKQDDMRKRYNSPKLKFYIGDVRDFRSVEGALRGVDFCFHAAALKQVPSCEFHPMEAVRTNVLGTENVLAAAIALNLKRVVCLSTDKAVYPINAMGMSKAMMEKVMAAMSRNLDENGPVICGVRYGNVMGSRGSVIPLFVSQVIAGSPLTVTDPNMTRFLVNVDDAITLAFYAFKNGRSGDIFVRKAPAATIGTLARAVVAIMNRPDHPVVQIGTRHGEKLHETLLSREEIACVEDQGDYFRIPSDTRDLNYSMYVERGEQRIAHAEEYNSHNTTRLDLEQTKEVLLRLEPLRRIAQGAPADFDFQQS